MNPNTIRQAVTKDAIQFFLITVPPFCSFCGFRQPKSFGILRFVQNVVKRFVETFLTGVQNRVVCDRVAEYCAGEHIGGMMGL